MIRKGNCGSVIRCRNHTIHNYANGGDDARVIAAL
jgi:hypothetical protein